MNPINGSLLLLLALVLRSGQAYAQDPAGYVWPLSVAPGETIEIFASGALIPENSLLPNLTFHRVTSDATGVLVTEDSTTAGRSIESVIQSVNSTAWRDGEQWLPSATFTIPDDWPTGFYTATLRGQSGVDFHITFTVKPAPAARHRTALLANVNTWNAYNNWGGRSKYTNAALTSFMRPNPGASLAIGVSPVTLPDTFFSATHLAHAEVWVLAAMEDYLGRGNVDVYSDIDFDAGEVQAGPNPGQYDRLILSTHPEYWSKRMYDNLRAFLDQGGSVLYLGGNGIFETAAYSTSAGAAALTFLNGDEGAEGQIDPSLRLPALFRVVDAVGDVPPRAERALLGVATTTCGSPKDGQPYVVKAHPPIGTSERRIFDALFRGVLGPSDSGREIGAIGVYGAGASGHEVDRVAMVNAGYVTNQPDLNCAIPDPPSIFEKDTTPDGVVLLAEGGLIAGRPGADMTYYRYPNPPGVHDGRGFVFSVGSVNFGQSLFVDEKLRTLLGNLLFEHAFTGFFTPIDNPPTQNTVKAGLAIPVKFSLNGFQGLDILPSGSPYSQAIPCAGGAPTDQVEETVSAGSSGLAYDAATDRYRYIWKTEKRWSGTCRRLVFEFNDLSEHVALFKFN